MLSMSWTPVAIIWNKSIENCAHEFNHINHEMYQKFCFYRNQITTSKSKARYTEDNYQEKRILLGNLRFLHFLLNNLKIQRIDYQAVEDRELTDQQSIELLEMTKLRSLPFFLVRREKCVWILEMWVEEWMKWREKTMSRGIVSRNKLNHGYMMTWHVAGMKHAEDTVDGTLRSVERCRWHVKEIRSSCWRFYKVAYIEICY